MRNTVYFWVMNKAGLIECIDSYLKPLGFHRKEKSWYKEDIETITVFAIDRSRWGEMYYVYIGVLFRNLSKEMRPKFYKCHGYMRVEHLGEKTEEYLNFEKEIDEDWRRQRIEELMNKSLRVLEKMKTVAGFRELLKQFDLKIFMLNVEAQKYLGVYVQ